MKIEIARYDKERGTLYYNLKELSHWDLNTLHQLLRADQARAKIMNQFPAGVKLLEEFDSQLLMEDETGNIRLISTKEEKT